MKVHLVQLDILSIIKKIFWEYGGENVPHLKSNVMQTKSTILLQTRCLSEVGQAKVDHIYN